jgi:hypothetical protein
MEQDPVGECLNCNTKGPLGTFCTNCEDTGFIYEEEGVTNGDEEEAVTEETVTNGDDQDEDNSDNDQELWDPVPYDVQLDMKLGLLHEDAYVDQVYGLMCDIGIYHFNKAYPNNSAQNWGRMWADRFESIGIKSIQQLIGNLLRLKKMLARNGIFISTKLLDCIAFYGSSLIVMFHDVSKFPIIKSDSTDEECDAIIKMMRESEEAKLQGKF